MRIREACLREPNPVRCDHRSGRVRPARGDVGVEAHEDVQVIVHDGEPAGGDGENTRKFLEPKLDPFLAVDRAFAEQESASDAAGDEVIPTSYGRVDDEGASHCHRWDLLGWSTRSTQIVWLGK
jgi:hypothetical protein